MEMDEDYRTDLDYLDANFSDYEDDACNKTRVVQFGAVVTPVFFTVVIMFSCVGNTLVLWVLVKYENLSSLTNVFLVNLAASDLVFTAGLPFWAHNISGLWTQPVCKAVNFIFFVGFYSSAIFLTMMTVHRYMAVVHPLSVALNRTKHHCVVISVIIWLLSFCVAAPHVMFNNVMNHTISDGQEQLYCEYEDINWRLVGTYQQNVFFLISFVTISFCYIQILGRLLRPMSHTRRKTIRLILTIVVFFFLGWAPYNLAIFLNSLIAWKVNPFNECNVSITIDYIYYISRLVAFSHCCLNPIFYVFMGIKFRNHLKMLLRSIWNNTNQSQNRHSHLTYSNGEDVSMY